MHAHLERTMSADTGIEVLCREFTEALTEVFAENAVGPARRGRLARAHAAVKKHPDHTEHAYFLAVESAFTHWEEMQNAGYGRAS
jgi:predicted HD phosphohydrolase